MSSAVPPEMIASVAALCGIPPSEAQLAVVKAEERQHAAVALLQATAERPQSAARRMLLRRLHYEPLCERRNVTKPRPPSASRSIRSLISKKDFASCSAFALRMQAIRRHLREIAARVPALGKFREQKELDIATNEGGQIEFFDEVFATMDSSSRGAVCEDEFVVFGQRVGGELPLVFSRSVFRMMRASRNSHAAPAADSMLTCEEMRHLVFPKQSVAKSKKLLAAHDVDDHDKLPQQASDAERSWETEGGWSADDAQLVRLMFSKCDADNDGLVDAGDIARFTLSFNRGSRGESKLLSSDFELSEARDRFQAQIEAFANDVSRRPDGTSNFPHQLSLAQFAAMQKPIFVHSRR